MEFCFRETIVQFLSFLFFPFFFSRDSSLHDATCAAEKVSGNVLTKLLSNFSLSSFAESANFERYKNWGGGEERNDSISFFLFLYLVL